MPELRGNSLALEQVIVNLIINASDAIKKAGKGLINISTSIDKINDNVIIEVEDNCMGMDQAVMKQIFNPFFTTKR